ncbi:hypothetical protein G7Y89_g15498 [Cudoniella acicularis]|uniref:DUF4139 domain-containing protein n=1 Tax=Cudoniella acicularis TaxID=354080 RepID=A0A8H4QLX7_9HELO|nr:hypothetical protein G7Y89_g15498 [Cudoniella acicularis]
MFGNPPLAEIQRRSADREADSRPTTIMADENTHVQEFRVRDLTTRSVLLFPTRAQIIRDIKEISLQPGANKIVINGLTPTADEHSIKVEGTGSATITDVSVDLLPNRELFEDIYPEDEDEDEDEEDDESEEEPEAMTAIVDKIKDLNIELLGEQEKINSAANRLQICDNLGKSVANKPPPHAELQELLREYREEREKIYKDHESSTNASEKIRDKIRKAAKEKTKLAKELVKANEKKEKEKAKLREKKLRQKAEAHKEKQRIKAERESFWPKKVYRVVVNLETSSFTPASSRRSSIDGDTVVNLATLTFHEESNKPLKTGDISLSLSYITYSASWSPRYDLALNTVKSAGLLEYGAELRNTTSETWRDAKVVLSTSQTNFAGLSEKIPLLRPWHVRLLKGGKNTDAALMSNAERHAKTTEWNNMIDTSSQLPRWEMFGQDTTAQTQYQAQQASFIAEKRARRSEAVQNVISSHNRPTSVAFGQVSAQSAAPTSLFGSTAPGVGGGAFGGTATNQQVTRSGGLFGSAAPQAQSWTVSSADDREKEEENVELERSRPVEPFHNSSAGLFRSLGAAGPRPPPLNPSLTFEAGEWEETGMTTTYDVPGLKTLAPSNSTLKHRIAKIEFKNVIFSHIVIGKLRQVAFLKARLRNTSRITLLKGPLGLTLDSSFLGQATFPRCSPDESFSLPLGVDPGITISYSKPTVRRSQTGIFSKEDSNVFSRNVVLLNTKRSTVEVTVLDQVPVSEDERLKIEVVTPRGLKVDGEGVGAGVNATASAAGNQNALVRTSTDSKGGNGKAKDVRASVYASSAEGGKANAEGRCEVESGV